MLEAHVFHEIPANVSEPDLMEKRNEGRKLFETNPANVSEPDQL